MKNKKWWILGAAILAVIAISLIIWRTRSGDPPDPDPADPDPTVTKEQTQPETKSPEEPEKTEETPVTNGFSQWQEQTGATVPQEPVSGSDGPGQGSAGQLPGGQTLPPDTSPVAETPPSGTGTNEPSENRDDNVDWEHGWLPVSDNG